jgi:putative ABC transport system ATP-binding protein
MSAIFELEQLSYGYIDGGKRRMILSDLSYRFEKGKFYTILGPSGSGKTTLLALASALDVPEKGRVLYNGADIRKIGYTKFRRDNMAIIFQKYNLTDYLTGLENVEANMMIMNRKSVTNRKEIAYKILSSVGIVQSKADRRVTKLSGGEQQRVAIARALAKDVDLIMGDEPTGALDTATAREIIELFKRLAHEYGKTIILVTHSDEVAANSDISLHLRDGKLWTEQEE